MSAARFIRILSRGVLVIVMAAAAGAVEPKPAKPPKPPKPTKVQKEKPAWKHPAVVGATRPLRNVPLTDLQKKQIDDLETRYSALIATAEAQATRAVPEEVRQKRTAAVKEAKTAGLSGPQVQAAADAAGPLTEEQQTIIRSSQTQVRSLQGEFLTALRELLTPAQQAALAAPPALKPKKP